MENTSEYAKFWLKFAAEHGTSKANYLEQIFWDATLKPFFRSEFQESALATGLRLRWITGVQISEVIKIIDEFREYRNRWFNYFDYRPAWNWDSPTYAN